ncbi:MAG TPA: guanylate kinase [Hyphomicrobiaceae bacterium]
MSEQASEQAGPGTPRIARRGLLLVLSSPSGAGKTTLARRLLAADPAIRLSVSVTTRRPRPGEIEGVDYLFVDKAEFERLKRGRRLLEWAEVFGESYATPKAQVLDLVEAGTDVLFDVDWQGARSLTRQLPADVVRVFILPPDGKALEERLRGRKQDSEAAMARRLKAAAGELSHWGEYDYVLVNADLEATLASLVGIVAAERLKRERQTGLETFVASLLAGL